MNALRRSLRLSCVVLALAGVVVLAHPPAAAMSAGWRQDSARATWFVSGARFVAWGTPDRRHVVALDTATGRRSLFRLSRRRCAPVRFFTVDRLLTGTRALLYCGLDPVLLDLRTGALRPLPDTIPGHPELVDLFWGEVGRRWVSGHGECGMVVCGVYLSLRTGRLHVERAGPLRDVDQPDLPRVPLCARTLAAWRPEYDLARLSGTAVLGVRKARRTTRVIERVSCRRTVTLGTASTYPGSLQVNSGLASWSVVADDGYIVDTPKPRGSVTVVDTSSTRTLGTWKTPTGTFHDCEGNVIHGSIGSSAHTARRVFFLRAIDLFPSDDCHLAHLEVDSRPLPSS